MAQRDADGVLQLLGGSLAESTLGQYASALSVVKRFCDEVGAELVPMQPEVMLRFLLWLKASDRVHGSSLRKFVAAITKLHEWRNERPPTSDALVRAAIAGYQRTTRDGAVRLNRVPLSVQHAHRIAESGLSAIRLREWRVAEACAAVVWQFVFFVRASTLARQRLDGVSLTDSAILVKLTYEKGDSMPGRVLSFTVPATVEAEECTPFVLLSRWCRWRKACGGEYLLSSQSEPYHSDIVELWRIACAAAAVEPPLHGRYLPHSARHGGASAAAAAGVSDVVLQVRGGWRSIATLRSYIHEVSRHPADHLYFGALAPTVKPLVSKWE